MNLARLAAETGFITPRIRQVWDRALAAPIDVEPTWLHGDPHARNVLSQAGRLTAFIDWGDMCGGDRATDLSSLWMLLPDIAARHDAMAAYGASEATWARAAGWAVNYAVVLVDAGRVNDPRLAAMGAKTFALGSLGDSFAAARDAVGLPKELGLHCLRHSYITHLIEAGYDPAFVQTQAGHAYASVTSVYTSVGDDFKQKTIQKMIARRIARPEEANPNG